MFIKPKLDIQISPTVNDVCAVISAVTAYFPGEEAKFLEAIVTATERRIKEINKDSDTNAE
jgi:hypothetical protein